MFEHVRQIGECHYLNGISLSQLSTFQNSRYGLSSSINIKLRNNCCIQVVFHILNGLRARINASSLGQCRRLQGYRLGRFWWRLVRIGIFSCCNDTMFSYSRHSDSLNNIRSLIFRFQVCFRFLGYTQIIGWADMGREEARQKHFSENSKTTNNNNNTTSTLRRILKSFFSPTDEEKKFFYDVNMEGRRKKDKHAN